MLSRTQLQKTIQALELKFQLSNEAVINEYLTTYKRLLNAVETETSDKDIKNLSQKLLGCTRGYLETSTDYQQSFLDEMAKSEKMIRESM